MDDRGLGDDAALVMLRKQLPEDRHRIGELRSGQLLVFDDDDGVVGKSLVELVARRAVHRSGEIDPADFSAHRGQGSNMEVHCRSAPKGGVAVVLNAEQRCGPIIIADSVMRF